MNASDLHDYGHIDDETPSSAIAFSVKIIFDERWVPDSAGTGFLASRRAHS
jgi:hypothetical protein